MSKRERIISYALRGHPPREIEVLMAAEENMKTTRAAIKVVLSAARREGIPIPKFDPQTIPLEGFLVVDLYALGDDMEQLQSAAERRGLSTEGLALATLETVIRANLFNAVLDDLGPHAE